MNRKQLVALLLSLILLVSIPLGLLSNARAETEDKAALKIGDKLLLMSSPLDATITLDLNTVAINHPIVADWDITGGTDPEISYAKWRIFGFEGGKDVLIDEIDVTAQITKSLTGSTSFTPAYGKKGEFYLHIDDPVVASQGFYSVRFPITGDDDPLKATITVPANVAMGGTLNATWAISGGDNPSIEYAEWVTYKADGLVLSKKQATGVTLPSGNIDYIATEGIEGRLSIRVKDDTGLVRTFESDKFNIDGWRVINGKTYYYINGEKQYRLLNIGAYTYYFAPFSGEMVTGWVVDSGKTYFFDTVSDPDPAKNGRMYKSRWYQEGTVWYYLQSDGVMAQDVTIEIFETINSIPIGTFHHFNPNGVWLGEAEPQNGWYQFDKKWYYNVNGIKQKNWVKLGIEWFYFSPTDGSNQSGWLQLGSARYYLKPNTDKKGVMVTGYHIIDGKYHSFNASGVWLGEQPALTGWLNENGSWYYYKVNVLQTGWLQDSNSWYYLNAEGKMQIGWVLDGGSWYYMKASGAMQTGWLDDGGDTYYLQANGRMAANGNYLVSGSMEIFDQHGVWQGSFIGWNQTSGKWYYYDLGFLQTGWKDITGTWYYLQPSTGEMTTGWQTVYGKLYYLSSSGAMQTGWVKVGQNWYYLNSTGAMQTGWLKDGTTWYYLKASGAMQTGWLQLGSTWYYLKSGGAMVTGIYKIDGQNHSFNGSGVWQGPV